MAKYIPIGNPVNRSEQDGMRLLRDVLPDHFIIIGNFELQLPRRKNTIEYDAVVVGDDGVYAVEIKGWNGKISGDVRRWQLAWGRVENPFIRTETKAKALRDFLRRQCDQWPDDLYCEAVVLLTGKKLKVNIEDPRQGRLLTMENAEAFFSQAHSERRGLIDDALREGIERAIAPLANPAVTSKILRDYEIIAELERPTQRYREFVGRHSLIRARRRVRIKSYTMDPLISIKGMDVELRRIMRDIEALSKMGDNPYVAHAYDMFRDLEDSQIFYLVSEWVGKITLADYMAEHDLPRLQDPSIWGIGLHLLKAVSYVHAQNVVHRDLHPGVVYMTEPEADVPLKIADFDFARIARMDSIAGTTLKIGTEGYIAPELWLSNDYDERVDIFSVGAILFELMSGQPLVENERDLMRQDIIWSSRKHIIEDEALRECLAGLLAFDSNARDEDLESAQVFFNARMDALS